MRYAIELLIKEELALIQRVKYLNLEKDALNSGDNFLNKKLNNTKLQLKDIQNAISALSDIESDE